VARDGAGRRDSGAPGVGVAGATRTPSERRFTLEPLPERYYPQRAFTPAAFSPIPERVMLT
jgi:hypothetical protein